MPKGPSIEASVVQAKVPHAKAKAATTQTPVIVVSISRHDAARKRAWDQVLGRDELSDDTDEALAARYRNLMEAALKTPKRS